MPSRTAAAAALADAVAVPPPPAPDSPTTPPSDARITPVAFADLLDQGWLAPLVVQRLPPADALRFAAASRACRVVRLRPPLSGLEASRSWSNSPSQYRAHEWQKLRLDEQHIHTVILRCEWKDQGWGNRKGMLSIVADGGKAPDDYQPWSPAVVAGKEPAPHSYESLELRFRPPPTDDEAPVLHGAFVSRLDVQRTYTLCARAGGGGGHALSVKDLTVRILAFVAAEEEET